MLEEFLVPPTGAAVVERLRCGGPSIPDIIPPSVAEGF